MNRELRPHQVRALELLRLSLGSGRRRPMVVAPTGAGKTLLAVAMVEGARRKDKRVLFIVPALSLIDQTVERFREEGLTDVGVIQARHVLTDWWRPIQIASIQTLAKRNRPAADLIVIDEAHTLHEAHKKLITDPALVNVPIIGLSATPWAKGLGKHFDDLIIAATTAELIDAGYLSKFRVFAPSSPDLSDVRVVAGEYVDADLSEAMAPLVADVVEQWLQRAQGRPTLCFAVDRAHAKQLQQQFLSAGVTTGYIDAYTKAEEREEIAGQFRRGQVQVVTNVGCLTTGIDWDVRCIVMARPTRSEMLFVQIVGRGLRTADGKDDLLILDHSDNHQRLGFVTDIAHDKLDMGRERGAARDRSVPLPKACPSCSFLKPPKFSQCPSCGFKPERRCEVEVEDGDLVEMTPGQQPAGSSNQDRQRFYSMVLQIGQERGYKPGWAATIFKQKFGNWPNGLHRFPREAEADVQAYVRSRQIAYARRRAA